jgi:signal transduction histidine kinase
MEVSEAAINKADGISSLWKTEEINQEITRVIEDPKESMMLYQRLASSAKSEALLLLPTGLEFVRAQRLGIIDNLIEASETRGTKVRILCPLDDSDKQLATSIQDVSKRVTILKYEKYSFASIFFIVNSNEFIRADLKNPNAQAIESALGLAVYSNSRPSVDTFKTFFDMLINQTLINEDFRKREKMKDEFIAVASHELRTPIQPILGFAFLARMGKMNQEEAWDAVLKEARRLQQLANDILDVSKMDSGNMIYFMDSERINRLLDLIANSARSALPSNVQLTVEYEESDADIEIQIDRSRITQVISNLLGNAMKFADHGSIKIQSKTLRNENKLEIRVSDTGRGISEEMLPLLFEKFATRGHGNVQNNKGTGLGLYICKAIVIGHKGEISAFNNSDGGATFVVTLPISIRK